MPLKRKLFPYPFCLTNLGHDSGIDGSVMEYYQNSNGWDPPLGTNLKLKSLRAKQASMSIHRLICKCHLYP